MNIEIIREVKHSCGLSFQYAKWNWENAEPTFGYRFIWRNENTGNLIPARGQAYIPTPSIMFELIAMAFEEGLFNED